MKKLFCLILALTLANCEIKPRSSVAQETGDPYSNYNGTYGYKEEIKDGMTYGIWYVRSQSSQTGYATSVVNLTKDKLEIELMRAQLLNELKQK